MGPRRPRGHGALTSSGRDWAGIAGPRVFFRRGPFLRQVPGGSCGNRRDVAFVQHVRSYLSSPSALRASSIR